VNKYKIIRLEHTNVSSAFEKEAELLELVRSGDLQQGLLLWRACDNTVVLPAGKKWQATPELLSKLKEKNWEVLSRRTGGAPVPQTPGVINISHIYTWNSDLPYSIQVAYTNICEVLRLFFNSFQLKTEIHSTPHSYCNGDYNVNIAHQKIVGTAQRVIIGKQDHKIILVQACILIDVEMDQLIYPINLCNKLNNNDDSVKSEVHTCLQQHISSVPSNAELYGRLVQAFIDFHKTQSE
jgi:lipoate-protein ligase A